MLALRHTWDRLTWRGRLESILGSMFEMGKTRKMAWEEHRLDSHCDEAHHVILAHNPRSGSDLPVLPLGADLETILYWQELPLLDLSRGCPAEPGARAN